MSAGTGNVLYVILKNAVVGVIKVDSLQERAWIAVNNYLYLITWNYFERCEDSPDSYITELSDEVCARWDELTPVLEWLEND